MWSLDWKSLINLIELSTVAVGNPRKTHKPVKFLHQNCQFENNEEISSSIWILSPHSNFNCQKFPHIHIFKIPIWLTVTLKKSNIFHLIKFRWIQSRKRQSSKTKWKKLVEEKFRKKKKSFESANEKHHKNSKWSKIY